jgi:hypothetical protein
MPCHLERETVKTQSEPFDPSAWLRTGKLRANGYVFNLAHSTNHSC